MIRQALSKILNRGGDNLNTTPALQNYYPAKFEEFVAPMEDQSKTNSNTLRMAPKTKKSGDPDPGYDQGRSVVNNNFFEDSGWF